MSVSPTVTPEMANLNYWRPPQRDGPGVLNPSDHDVLCGRGVTTNRHKGNEKFRSLVNLNKELYVTSTKRQKMGISKSIVEAVRSLDPPGRFLEKDPSSGVWFDIGDKKAVEKTSQALRDGAASLRKQLSRDLGDPDFLSAVFDSDNVELKNKPDPKKPSAKQPAKKKEKIPAKGHRRTRSNPVMTNHARKTMVFKPGRGPSGEPLSPVRRDGLQYPPPGHFSPQSPLSSASSDHSAPSAFMLRSPGSYPHMQYRRHHASPRSPRAYGSGPPLPYPHEHDGSFDYPPERTGSFDQQRPPPMSPPGPPSFPTAGQTPPPSSYGPSPTCSSGPHSAPHHPTMNPRSYAGGPRMLGPGRHHLSPAGYQHTQGPPPPSYSWSPRRTHPGQPYHEQQQQPQYMSPPHGPPQRPPEYYPGMPPPQQHQHYHHGRGPYQQPPPYGGPDLHVPNLGHEQRQYHHHPMSPRWQHPSQSPVPQDFAPPLSPPQQRRRSESVKEAEEHPKNEKSTDKSDASFDAELNRSSSSLQLTMSSMEMGIEVTLEEDDDDSDDSRFELSDIKLEMTDSNSRGSSPLPPETPPRQVIKKEEDGMASPSAVPDIGLSDDAIDDVDLMLPPAIERKTSRDDRDDHPFDEDQDPAMEPISVSPLPYSQEYCIDPCSLMFLPENLLNLPISPCGPYDGQ